LNRVLDLEVCRLVNVLELARREGLPLFGVDEKAEVRLHGLKRLGNLFYVLDRLGEKVLYLFEAGFEVKKGLILASLLEHAEFQFEQGHLLVEILAAKRFQLEQEHEVQPVFEIRLRLKSNREDLVSEVGVEHLVHAFAQLLQR